jgi:hypothetical protein
VLLEVQPASVALHLTDVCDAVGSLLWALVDYPAHCDILECAKWPYQRLPSLVVAVGDLARLPQSQRHALAMAYDHDREYAEHADDENFAFAFGALPDTTKERASSLFKLLYERMLGGKTGFVRDGSTTVQRLQIHMGFLQSNTDLHVCPACLSAQLLGVVQGRSSAQLDHVLPKATYGVLAVHPLNLLPLCSDCNFLKRDKDPLTGGALPSAFLPYMHGGLQHVDLAVAATAPDGTQIRLRARTPASLQPVATLERLLHLSARWSAYVRTYHVTLVRHLQFELGVNASADDVRARLQSEFERAELEVTLLPSKIVEACWARWLANDGLGTLLAELRA